MEATSTIASAREDTEEELDLTNSHLPDLGEVVLTDSLTSVDLTANRLKVLEEKLLKLSRLKKLSLRQNLLTSAEPVAQLANASGLETLVLHDNHLEDLPPLRNLAALVQLEVSYNQIRSLAGMADLPTASLHELYAASNKITKIEAVAQLTNLRFLELGNNRIREIEGLDTLAQLEELWLGRNRISQVCNLTSLTSLRKISVQSNRLVEMTGFERCTQLQELYLSHNGIIRMEGLEQLTSLSVLDLSNNQLEQLHGLDTVTALQDLWLNDNSIQTLDNLEEDLRGPRQSLTCVYLAHNPASADVSKYKAKLKELLPKLEQLDADAI